MSLLTNYLNAIKALRVDAGLKIYLANLANSTGLLDPATGKIAPEQWPELEDTAFVAKLAPVLDLRYALLSSVGAPSMSAARTLTGLAFGGPGSAPEAATTLFPITATYSDRTTAVLSSGPTVTTTVGTIDANGALTIPADTIQGNTRPVTLTATLNGVTTSKTISIIDTTAAAASAAPTGDTVVITVSLGSTPNAANLTVVPAALPYGKKVAFGMVFDDNKPVALAAATALIDAPDATTYTDWCGNVVRCSFDIALNRRSPYDNAEMGAGDGSNYLTYAQVNTLAAKNVRVQNHGSYHQLYAQGLFPYSFNGDVTLNLTDNQNEIFARYQQIPRLVTRPNKDDGYVAAATPLGYLGVVSQGGENGYTLYNEEYMHAPAVEQVPYPFGFLGRQFPVDDLGTAAAQDDLVNKFALAVADASAVSHPVLLAGFHGVDVPGLKAVVQRIKATGGDDVAIMSPTAIYEHRDTAKRVKLSTSLSGTTLTITVDYSAASPRAATDNLSLFLDTGGVAVTGISVQGTGVSATSNNAFKGVGGQALVNLARPRIFTSASGKPR